MFARQRPVFARLLSGEVLERVESTSTVNSYGSKAMPSDQQTIGRVWVEHIPTGDKERLVTGRQWDQRAEVMRTRDNDQAEANKLLTPICEWYGIMIGQAPQTLTGLKNTK